MKRMLFNATQAEELRVGIVDGQKLIDLDIESATKEERKSNIYKAVITRIEPSLEAAFVDYGAERHGFLPFKEISKSYFAAGNGEGRPRIQDALKEGQELIVQVEKDERGNKGAALTTYISLAGRYLVLMPNNPRGGGVSRRVEGDERAELREVMDQLEVPNGMSLIARTAAIGRNSEELQWDLNYLMQLWLAIEGAANTQPGAFLIYQEGSLVIRAIRDYFQPDIGEILIDTDDVYEQARQFMAHVMPQNVNRVKRYHDDVPLFSRFQIEHQIESAYSRQVNLPSGGAVVIDHTEALVSVDVNSGRATRGADIEETALRTNQEAADEIARQLRLRDLGGLIVIDFIDMESQKNQREVENRLRDALRHDRARVQTGKISRFGLLELSRQRLRPALAETSYIPCPRCNGTGHIRSTESSALHIVRIIEEEAMKDNTGAVHCQVPVDVATFLLNEKRVDIAHIEMRHKVNIVVIPNRHLETPQHEIIRLRHDQLNAEESTVPSYQMAAKPAEEGYRPPSARNEAAPARQEAAVKGISPGQPAPVVETQPQPEASIAAPVTAPAKGIFSKLFSWFRGEPQQPAAPVAEPKPAEPARREGRNGRSDGRRDGGRGGRNRRDGQRDESRGERNDRAERPDRAERDAEKQAARNRSERGEERGNNRRKGGERSEEKAEGQAQAREPRQPRPPREPRQKKDAAQKPVDESQSTLPLAVVASAEETVNPVPDAPAEEAAEGATPPRSRRSRRGRRGERRSDEQRNADGSSENLGVEGAAAVAAAAPIAAAAVVEAVQLEISETPRAEAREADTTLAEPVAAPVEPAPLPVAAGPAEEITSPALDEAPAPMPVPVVEAETPQAEPRESVVIAAVEPAAVENETPEAAPALVVAADEAPAIIAEVREEMTSTQAEAAVADVPVDTSSETPTVEPAPEVVVASAPETEPVQAAAPIAEALPAAEPEPAPAIVQQAIDLGAPLEEIGLQMVETNPAKLATAVVAETEAPVKLGRRPRPRPVVETEELQQVQTHGK